MLSCRTIPRRAVLRLPRFPARFYSQNVDQIPERDYQDVVASSIDPKSMPKFGILPKQRSKQAKTKECKDSKPSAQSASSSASSAAPKRPNTTSRYRLVTDTPVVPKLDYMDHNMSSFKQFGQLKELPEYFGINQHMGVDREFERKLRRLLGKFRAPIGYCFAYGSGVFSQGYKPTEKPQIDLIMGVSYTEHWHSINMEQNPKHYSGLRMLGSGVVAATQDRIGAGVYFNPYVELDGLVVKYGVVNINTLLEDLSDWNTLYLAGRLHKPVKILQDDPRVKFINQNSLISAVRVALLMLPQRFTERELYKQIAGISYLGDVRMSIGGENPRKVDNIVDNQFGNFRRMYGQLLALLPNLAVASAPSEGLSGDFGELTFEQDENPLVRGNMVSRLPASFRHKLYQKFREPYASALDAMDAESKLLQFINTPNVSLADPVVKLSGACTEFDQLISQDEQIRERIAQCIRETVKGPSMAQMLKGIATSGLVKSAKYGAAKLGKYLSA